MKFLIILSILVVANGFIDPHFRNRHYKPKLGKMPGINDAKRENFDLNINPLIVGGQEAIPHSLPYNAALYIDADAFCGGALISDQFVLTAAHCTFEAYIVFVVLGAHNKSASELTQETFESTGDLIITHEDYNEDTRANNIALVKLPRPATLTASIQPIALPSVIDTDLGPDQSVIISGWGTTIGDPSAPKSDVLKEATVTTISNLDCAYRYGTIAVTNTTLCTSSVTGGGTCYGDAGDPLTFDSGNGPVHRGLATFIPITNCTAGDPNAFIRTTHYLEWIQQHLEASSKNK
jgi:secreted trypsin-like serine protease